MGDLQYLHLKSYKQEELLSRSGIDYVIIATFFRIARMQAPREDHTDERNRPYLPGTGVMLVQLILLIANIIVFVVSIMKSFNGYPLGILSFLGFLCFRNAIWEFYVALITKNALSASLWFSKNIMVVIWILIGIGLLFGGGWGKTLIPWLGGLCGWISSYPTIQKLRHELASARGLTNVQ